MCDNIEEIKEVYDFTYIDELGLVNHMYKEEIPNSGNIVDVLYAMKQFLLMCGFSVDELIVKNNTAEFSTEDY